jgi:hypothetical protein
MLGNHHGSGCWWSMLTLGMEGARSVLHCGLAAPQSGCPSSAPPRKICASATFVPLCLGQIPAALDWVPVYSRREQKGWPHAGMSTGVAAVETETMMMLMMMMMMKSEQTTVEVCRTADVDGGTTDTSSTPGSCHASGRPAFGCAKGASTRSLHVR